MENKGSFQKDTKKGNDSSMSLIDKKEDNSIYVTEANGSHNCPSDKEGNNLSYTTIERM